LERYDRGAMALHWISATLILANLLLGVSMVQLAISPRKLQWYLSHKSIGITVFALTSVRLAWRTLHPVPAAVAMPAWQRRAARLAHAALYALLLLIPLTGWLYSSATGVQVVWLGWVPLPTLLDKDRALATVLRDMHVGLNVLLATLLVLHIAAALKHHFVDRDDALRRMLPFAGRARVRPVPR
jgi:cytochrome b561